MMRLAGTVVATVAAVSVLSGCGSDASSATDLGAGPSTGPSSSDTSAASTFPSCGNVWHAGAVLPLGYKGCSQGSTDTPADRLGCSSGQRIVRFDNHWYAVLGGQIHHSKNLRHDASYIHSVRVCRG